MACMSKKTLSEIIRQAIKESGKSAYRITRDIGLADGQLLRFIRDERQVGNRVLDKLVEYLGVQITKPRQNKSIRHNAGGPGKW